MYRWIEGIMEVAPVRENSILRFRLGQSIGQIIKTDGLAVGFASHMTDAVRKHFKIGDRSLRGEFIGAFGPCDGGGDLLSLCAGQLAFEG